MNSADSPGTGNDSKEVRSTNSHISFPSKIATPAWGESVKGKYSSAGINLAGSRNRMNMKTGIDCARMITGALTLAGVTLLMPSPAAAAPPRPQGPCDIYAKAGAPCVAAHSTTRAMYASYNGPLYQVLRQSDGKTLDIGIVQPSGSDAGGYANAAAQDAFCANTYCWITTIYDQSGKHNDL